MSQKGISKKNQKNWKSVLEIDRLNSYPFKETPSREGEIPVSEKAKPQQRREFTLFSYSQYYEQEIVKKKIRELIEVIKQEVEIIKKTNIVLHAQLKDVERLTNETISEKPGIYHVRFLEIILSMLVNLRKKIGESKTWLEALMTKKKKRGSLFAVRAKKMGTLYSLSQELQSARSIQ